jgi:4-amino-4-deoxy-L-arabinose transferase-like glycosyltransferase
LLNYKLGTWETNSALFPLGHQLSFQFPFLFRRLHSNLATSTSHLEKHWQENQPILEQGNGSNSETSWVYITLALYGILLCFFSFSMIQSSLANSKIESSIILSGKGTSCCPNEAYASLHRLTLIKQTESMEDSSL